MPTNPTDHEALRRYLLGEQPEPETEILERRLLEEADLSELALAVEEELIEDCARGDLSPEQCEHLLAPLTASPAGRERIAFQRALRKAFVGRPKVLPPPLPFPARWWQAAARHPGIAASLAACLVAATIAGLVGPGVWPSHTHRPGVVENAPAVPQGTAEFAHHYLTMEQLRGGSPGKEVFPIHHPSQRIELEVYPGEKPFPHFRVTLKVRDGDVWREVPLADDLYRAGEERTFVLRLPVLTEGTYRVEVDGITPAGELERIGDKKFEVVVQIA